MKHLLNKYSDIISNLPELKDSAKPNEKLKLWENSEKKIRCFYAPFEHLNNNAQIVLIGITPGKTQMNRALVAAKEAIKSNTNIEKSIAKLKQESSFSGNMRNPLIETLNKLGYQKLLGITSASELWTDSFSKVHFCSLLKYPVFYDDKKSSNKDYNGKPNPFKIPELKKLMLDGFAKDLEKIPKSAKLIPLGETVSKYLNELDKMGVIPQDIFRFNGQIVAPPHPSGANAEEIALLCTDTFPTKSDYLDKMYKSYIQKNKIPKQNEATYKKTRAKRWENISFLRSAYELQ
tara:strand:+ start:33 stop:905 length:873 start_codon:yes stop_codon:yes gene_type:complete